MRSVPPLLCVALVLLAAAWREPQTQTFAKKSVTIHFKCETDGGATVTIKPWKRNLDARTDYIEWTLVVANPELAPDSVLIAPKSVNSWPFATKFPITVKKSSPGVAQGIPSAVPGATYKYSVTGICNVPGMPPDTVVIDPDMIIPGH